MNAAKLTLSLSAAEVEAFLNQCRRELILPEDWLRRALRQKLGEPFLVEPPQSALTSETSRMLAILEDLWKKAPEKFAAAAEGIGGHSRLWFATDPVKIWASGSSNKCAQIGNSPWWVTTNCPWNGMTSRIEKIMSRMGFTARYARMVSYVVLGGTGSFLTGDYFK